MIGVVILAAGESKRMGGVRSKVTIPLMGKPVIKYVFDRAKALKPDKIVMIVGKDSVEVRKILSNEEVVFIEQKRRDGTAGALMLAEKEFRKKRGKILVLMGDVPLVGTKTLKKLLKENNCACTIASVEVENPFSYGRIIRNEKGEFLCIREEKEASTKEKKINEINTGIYTFELSSLWKYLKKVKPSSNGELYLTDVPELMKRNGSSVKVLKFKNPLEFTGINTPEDFAVCEEIFRMSKVRELQKKGVIISHPESVWISEDAIIKRGTLIKPYTFILGKSVIEERCEIGPFVYIENSKIKNGTVVHFNSHIKGAEIGPENSIGPFARIRERTVTQRKVKIGNFVELKNTKVGKNTKANHLSYLGDATIGENVNIGAGVITCNYDGEKKHPTFIGSNSFIGSDVQLIAPVKIGENTYIGAGSTITRDVPSGALGISRSPQKTITDYYFRKKKKSKKKKEQKDKGCAE